MRKDLDGALSARAAAEGIAWRPRVGWYEAMGYPHAEDGRARMGLGLTRGTTHAVAPLTGWRELAAHGVVLWDEDATVVVAYSDVVVSLSATAGGQVEVRPVARLSEGEDPPTMAELARRSGDKWIGPVEAARRALGGADDPTLAALRAVVDDLAVATTGDGIGIVELSCGGKSRKPGWWASPSSEPRGRADARRGLAARVLEAMVAGTPTVASWKTSTRNGHPCLGSGWRRTTTRVRATSAGPASSTLRAIAKVLSVEAGRKVATALRGKGAAPDLVEEVETAWCGTVDGRKGPTDEG